MILIEREKVCAETTDSRILIKIVDSCCISRMAFDTRFDGAKNAYSIDTESRSLIQLILCFSQKLDLGASASVAKPLFHWLRGGFMMLKRMLRIQFL